MWVTKIPNLGDTMTGWLDTHALKAEIILEDDKSPAMDGREYLGYLKEFIAKADDVKPLWVDRSMFMNSACIWIRDKNDEILGSLVFRLTNAKKPHCLGVLIASIHSDEMLCKQADSDSHEVCRVMIECLKCLLLSGRRLTQEQANDKVFAGIVAACKNEIEVGRGFALIFITEVEWGCKPDKKELDLIQSCGLSKAQHIWTTSMSAVTYELQLFAAF